MIQRAEYERQITAEDRPGLLFVSSGPRDDYVEIVLPADARDSHLLRELDSLSRDADSSHLDVRVADGDPPTVCVLALYATEEERRQPYQDRVSKVLTLLARSARGLDFGDLVPEHLLAAAESRSASDDRPTELASQADSPRAESAPSNVVSILAAIDDEDRRSSDAASRAEKVASLCNRAGDLAARGRIHKALRAVEDALRADSSNPSAWALREDLTLLEKRERARQRYPKSAQAHLEAGFSYLSLGCDEEAIESLGRARELKPDLYLAHVLLGIAYHHKRLSDDAGRCYRRAAQLRPSDQTPTDLLASLRRGEPPPRPVEDRPRGRRIPPPLAARHLATAG